MNTRFATPPYKRRGSKIVKLLFVETGLRPVFFLCYDYNKFGAVSQISTFRDMNDTNFVEKFSYNSDGRVKQYVKRFFGELLNTCGEIEPKLLCNIVSHEMGHLYDFTIGYNSDEYRAEGYIGLIYNRYWNYTREYIGWEKRKK